MSVSRAVRTNSIKILTNDSKTMTETLERVLAPLMIIGSFFNLYMIEYPRGQCRPYLSYLYALAIWSFLTYYCFYEIYYLSYLLSGIIFTDYFVPLLTIMLILTSFCRFKVKNLLMYRSLYNNT